MGGLINNQFLRFALVGTAGFLVDWGLLTLALDGLGLGYYVGRVFSFMGAVTFTWAANRHFTFPGAASAPALAQWRLFISVNFIGWLVNYGVYAGLVAGFTLVQDWPVIGVAAGSLAGLAFNFTGSKKVVFKTDVPSQPDDSSLPDDSGN